MTNRQIIAFALHYLAANFDEATDDIAAFDGIDGQRISDLADAYEDA